MSLSIRMEPRIDARSGRSRKISRRSARKLNRRRIE
jgi:hypothetical protein